MNLATTNLDKQINNYLTLLNTSEKKALLIVAKTFAENRTDEYSDEFKAELDSRYEDYKNGDTLISEEDANKRIAKIIKGKARK